MNERHQLRNRAFQALHSENVRLTRMKALQNELEALKRDTVSNNTKTQSAVEQYAKSECNQLTHNVMMRLPRELRDMIYQHLSTRHDERIEREHFRTTLDPLTRLYSYDHARWKASHYPEHFWNADYVGTDFFRELVENYYRTSTFIFSDDLGVMKKFLDTDEMKLNILPKELVCNVELQLRAVSRNRTSFQAYMFGAPQKPERIQETVEGIFELKPGAKIRVHYITDAKTAEEREKHCGIAVKTVLSSAQISRMAGYKVKFLVDEDHEHTLEEIIAQQGAEMHS